MAYFILLLHDLASQGYMNKSMEPLILSILVHTGQDMQISQLFFYSTHEFNFTYKQLQVVQSLNKGGGLNSAEGCKNRYEPKGIKKKHHI